MNIFEFLAARIKQILHFKPTELKGTPGVKDPAALAKTVNSGTEGAVSLVEAVAPAVVQNALLVHPAQLKGTPGVSDTTSAAALINAVEASVLGGDNAGQ